MSKAPWRLHEDTKAKQWLLYLPKELKKDQYPKAAEVLEVALARGINPHSFLPEEVLEESIEKAKLKKENDTILPIVLDPNFDVRITISLDKTKASLYVRKPVDKALLDINLIFKSIEKYKFHKIDIKKVKKDIQNFITSPKMELKDYLLAEGVSPTRGKDRVLLPSAEFLPEEEAQNIKKTLIECKNKNRYIESDIILQCEQAQHIAMIEKEQIVCTFSEPEFGTDGIDVYGNVIPGLPGNDPYFYPDKNITIVAAGLKTEIDGVLLFAEIEGETKIRVVPFVPAKIDLITSSDNMLATLFLESEKGAGKELTLDLVKTVLEDQGIKGNINYTAIEKAIQEARKTEKRIEVIAVRGEKPVAPDCYKLHWCLDYIDTPDKAIVQAGQILLELEKMPSGSTGLDIFGNTIPQTSELCELVPSYDKTIQEKTENGKQILIANVSGELQVGEKLTILDTKKHIGDIANSDKDILFPGNYELTGNIASGKKIKASGYIHISGNAEMSLLTAEKSVTMIGGIKGGGRGTVWAKKEINLSYAENARILAGNDISISDYCFNCVVKTNGKIIMSGNPGVLLGGSIRASKGMHVLDLGCSKRLRTNISFGQNYLIGDQIEVSERESETIRANIEKINEEMDKTSSKDPKIHQLRKKKLELLKRNDMLTVRIFTLKEQFETHVISSIRVDKTVYPGVVLESHGRYYEVRKKMNHVMFIFDQTTGQIKAVPIPDN